MTKRRRARFRLLSGLTPPKHTPTAKEKREKRKEEPCPNAELFPRNTNWIDWPAIPANISILEFSSSRALEFLP